MTRPRSARVYSPGVGARAGIVVTGTEVLTGRVADRNGPWVAEQLRVAGVDVGFTVVVGDRPDDLLAALRFLAAAPVDLIVTSGGLGPTADDLTAAVVGDWQGRPSAPDPALEARITAVVERLTARRGWTVDPEAMAAGTAKQALVPAGAEVLEPTGTAPGLVVPPSDGLDHPPVLVLPGPPGELQAMWPAATASPLVAAVLTGQDELRQATVRLWGTPEAAIAATLRRLEADPDALAGLEVTTCLREGELEVVTRYDAASQQRYDALVRAVVEEYGDAVFSTDGRTVEAVVADLLEGSDLTIGTAESGTAGLLAARLVEQITERLGSAARVRGGVVVPPGGGGHDLLGLAPGSPGRHGPVPDEVSEEAAVALAHGARRALGADIGVGVTGSSAPVSGGQEGVVHVCVATADRDLRRAPVLGGGPAQVRTRTVATALHLVRALLQDAA